MVNNMNKYRKAVIERNEISRLETFSLGGHPQKVLLEGKSHGLPLVLCLHGGPGSPIPFCVGCRGLFPELTDRFLMVYWDQLGCGANNYPIDDSFTIDSFAQMTLELAGKLKEEYPDTPLYLFGMSWGSILAAKAAAAQDTPVEGVLVYGQVLRELGVGREVYEALMQAQMPGKQKDMVEQFFAAEEKDIRQLQKITGLIRKYTNGYQNREGKAALMGDLFKGILTSPDYHFKDICAIAVNGYRKNESLLKELLNLDLRPVLQEISVPYYMIQGETDIVTSTKALRDFVENSKNPNLHWEMVPREGHIPGAVAMERVMDRLREITGKAV